MTDFEYLNECMMRDLTVMLVRDYDVSVAQALDMLFNSETYIKLQDAKTGLYFQSPVYVYDFLKTELTTGRFS